MKSDLWLGKIDNLNYFYDKTEKFITCVYIAHYITRDYQVL